MPARLTALFSDRPAQRLLLEGDGPWLVGRAAACDLALADDRISRRHARIRACEGPTAGGAWSLEDLGSKNGTSVDGRRLDPGDPAPLPAAPTWLDLGGLPVRFEPLSEERVRADREAREARWRTSLHARRGFDPGRGLRPLLDQLLRSVRQVAGAERAFVLLERADGELEVAATSGMEVADLGRSSFAGSAGAVELCLEDGAPVVVADALTDPSLGPRPSIVSGRIRSVACLPLEVLGRRAGVVYADTTDGGSEAGDGVITELDLEILEALVSHAGLAIAVARLGREADGLAGELPTREDPRAGAIWRDVTAGRAGFGARSEPPAGREAPP